MQLLLVGMLAGQDILEERQTKIVFAACKKDTVDPLHSCNMSGPASILTSKQIHAGLMSCVSYTTELALCSQMMTVPEAWRTVHKGQRTSSGNTDAQFIRRLIDAAHAQHSPVKACRLHVQVRRVPVFGNAL